MSEHQQRQQRWLLRLHGQQAHIVMRTQGAHDQVIRDWFTYLPTPLGPIDPVRTVRFRQINHGPITISSKRPIDDGERRLVQTVQLDDWDMAALGPPSLEKRRYTLEDGRFILDIYENLGLRGFAILEQRFMGNETPLPLPEWTHVFAPLDVTHSLTNGHLALIHEPGDALTSQARLMERLGKRTPTIVMTGAPCSGKTTIIDHVALHMPHIRVVPEAATIAIVHLRCHPPRRGSDTSDSLRFQRTIRDIQLLFEGIARQTVVHEKERAVLLDRGVVDGHAYLSGDPDDAYYRYFGTTPNEDYKRYKAVIHLAPPPRDAFEANKRKNPARRENYEDMLELDARISQAWKAHHRYVRVGDHQSWQEKFATALNAIEDFTR